MKHFRFTTGVRYEYFDYNRFASFSPRLGLSYFINPKMTFNLTYGKHYQSPAYIELVANSRNQSLKNKFTDQYIAGLEYLFRDDMKLVLEAYYKKYDDVPINKTLTTVDPYDFNDLTYVNSGSGAAKGIELFFQNIYNQDNIWSYNYNDNGTRDRVLQYKTLPVGGVSVEF